MPTPSKISVKRLTNANIYINGNSFLGRAEEVTTPMIKYKQSEHKALGMIGTFELFSGIDKIEAKIKWNSLYEEVLKEISNPTQVIKMQVRGSIETYDATGRAEEVPVICYMDCFAKDFPMGNFKQHDNVEIETNFNVVYAKLEINGVEKYEVDILSNILVIEGKDVLATYRANLGI